MGYSGIMTGICCPPDTPAGTVTWNSAPEHNIKHSMTFLMKEEPKAKPKQYSKN
jgi:hypothetical protein